MFCQNKRLKRAQDPLFVNGFELAGHNALIVPAEPPIPLPDGFDDRELQVVIRLEANAQERDSPILALARWIFSQRTGFA